MKLTLQLAYKNIIGAGLRTWLNVAVLSFVFVVIIFYRGWIDGWEQQSVHEAIQWEYGNGQLRNEAWDVADPFTITDGHGVLPQEQRDNLTPVLLRQGSIYPEGRLFSIVIKGIEAQQQIVDIPTRLLVGSSAEIPAVIGSRMAESAGLKKGDQVLLRWRDKNGTFDAANITIAGIFSTQIATVDNGQIWIPIQKLRQMTGLDGQTTYFIAKQDYQKGSMPGWDFVTQEELLKDLRSMVQAESIGGFVLYMLLLSIALLAVFDTQVLSIFRRQKEIGTFISLGMTRRQVTRLFTLEGAMYSLLGTVMGVIWGLPIFLYVAHSGIGMGNLGEGLYINMASRIYPEFGARLIVTTLLLIIGTSTLVSFIPSRKIAHMNPVLALKGKLQ